MVIIMVLRQDYNFSSIKKVGENWFPVKAICPPASSHLFADRGRIHSHCGDKTYFLSQLALLTTGKRRPQK